MKRKTFCLLLLLITSMVLFWIPVSQVNAVTLGWGEWSPLVNGLGDLGSYSTVCYAFNVTGDGNWTLIAGEDTDNTFNGFYWNGSSWVADATRVVGLDIGATDGWAAPWMEYNLTGDGNWVLICGEDSTDEFSGFFWNGTGWESNSTLVSGLATGDGWNKPCFKYNVTGDGKWEMFIGNNGGEVKGFYWTGAGWTSDNSRSAGLDIWGDPYYEALAAPTLAYNLMNDGKWACIEGSDAGKFYGFYWNGSYWVGDSAIVNQLPDIGSQTTPCIRSGFHQTYWTLISGRSTGDFKAYRLGIACTVEQYPDTTFDFIVNGTEYTTPTTVSVPSMGGSMNFAPKTLIQTVLGTTFRFAYWTFGGANYYQSNVTVDIQDEMVIVMHFAILFVNIASDPEINAQISVNDVPHTTPKKVEVETISYDDFENSSDGWQAPYFYSRASGSSPYHGSYSMIASSGYTTTDPFYTYIYKTFDFRGKLNITLTYRGKHYGTGLLDWYKLWFKVVDADNASHILVTPYAPVTVYTEATGTWHTISPDMSNCSGYRATVYIASQWDGYDTLPIYCGDGQFDVIDMNWINDATTFKAQSPVTFGGSQYFFSYWAVDEFKEDFENWNVNGWTIIDENDGDFSVTGEAKFDGDYGAKFDLNTAEDPAVVDRIQISKSFTATSQLVGVAFWMKFDNLTMSDWDAFDILTYEDTNGLRANFTIVSNGTEAYWRYTDDLHNNNYTAYNMTTGVWYYVVSSFRCAASGDGRASLKVNENWIFSLEEQTATTTADITKVRVGVSEASDNSSAQHRVVAFVDDVIITSPTFDIDLYSQSISLKLTTDLDLVAHYIGGFMLKIASEPELNVQVEVNGVPQSTPYSTGAPDTYYLVAEPEALGADNISYYFAYWSIDGVPYRNLGVFVDFSGIGDVNVNAHYVMAGGIWRPPPEPTARAFPPGLAQRISEFLRAYGLWILLLLLLVVICIFLVKRYMRR